MRQLTCAFLVAFLACGCEERLGPERISTVPVRGTVLFKGLPAQNLSVTFHALDERTGNGIYTSTATAMTGADGEFEASTYEQGDGLAPGSYAVTFEWLNYRPLGNQWTGPDKLGGKYSNPDKTEFKVSVTGDEEAIELKPYELTK